MRAAPAVRFRKLVENALTHLSWFDTVRDELNLTGISQIWDEEPAWYFWLGQRSYLLRYANLVEESPNDLTAILHAFPTCEEWDEGRCSHALLTTEHFDFATMTPRFESFALFKEAFIVGEMTFSLTDGKLQLLAASSHEEAWEKVWAFTELFVALLTFQHKVEPSEAPYFFSPMEKVSSVLVPFDASGSAIAKVVVATDPYRHLPTPMNWHRMAHQEFTCTASGTCACSHEH